MNVIQELFTGVYYPGIIKWSKLSKSYLFIVCVCINMQSVIITQFDKFHTMFHHYER